MPVDDLVPPAVVGQVDELVEHPWPGRVEH